MSWTKLINLGIVTHWCWHFGFIEHDKDDIAIATYYIAISALWVQHKQHAIPRRCLSQNKSDTKLFRVYLFTVFTIKRPRALASLVPLGLLIVFKHVRTVHVVLIVFILCTTDSRNTSIGISCKPIHLFTEEMPCSSALTYTGISFVKQSLPILKVDFHSKSKKLHMYLYFIAT